MRWAVLLILILPCVHLPLGAQKFETQTRNSTAIKRVETALDHLTVIEVSDPVTMVAVGNQNRFRIERRGNRVFVKPTQEGAQTNLFIWTASGRYAYELVAASGFAEMHFAIDQEAPPVVASKVERPVQQDPPGLPVEMLTEGMPVTVYGERDTDGRIEISIRDLYRKNQRLYVRYTITNRSIHPYHPGVPAAWQLKGARAPQSLLGLSGAQLGEQLARTLKVVSELSLPLVGSNQTSSIEPGASGIGWLIVNEPLTQADESTILRFQFASDIKGELGTVVVLGRQVRTVQDVAHARESTSTPQR